MDRDKNIEWIKDKFNKGKEELVRLTKISKLKIEVASTKKKIDEKLKNLGLKVYQMSKEGEIFPENLNLDFESINLLEDKIKELEFAIGELKAQKGDIDDVEEDTEVVNGEVIAEESKAASGIEDITDKTASDQDSIDELTDIKKTENKDN